MGHTNQMMSKLHAGWSRCTKCRLHKTRKMVVIGEGFSPADILFIGEGPGKTENIYGRPFIGSAGKTLREILAQAGAEAGSVTCFITNVVACRPCDKINSKNRPPTDDEAWACFPRLEKIYTLVRPKAVIFLGRVPERLCKKAFPEGRYIEHPASFERKGGLAGPHYRGYRQTFVDLLREVNHVRAD